MKLIWKYGSLPAAAVFAAALASAPGGALLAQKTTTTTTETTATTQTSGADQKFAKEAAEGGMLEVELGHVAVQKAANEKVKQFGQRMVDDHTMLNNQLKQAAAKANVTLPAQIDAKQRAMISRLSGMSGPEFDRAYMKDMVKDHEHDIAEFQKEANNGMNPELKNAAQMALPILQQHLTLAKETVTSLGITSKK